jgi:hypothetical protein
VVTGVLLKMLGDNRTSRSLRLWSSKRHLGSCRGRERLRKARFGELDDGLPNEAFLGLCSATFGRADAALRRQALRPSLLSLDLRHPLTDRNGSRLVLRLQLLKLLKSIIGFVIVFIVIFMLSVVLGLLLLKTSSVLQHLLNAALMRLLATSLARLLSYCRLPGSAELARSSAAANQARSAQQA